MDNGNKFWREQVDSVISNIHDLYGREVSVDWDYKDSMSKVDLDGKFVAVTGNKPIEVLQVVDAIYSMIVIFRNEQLDRLSKELHSVVH